MKGYEKLFKDLLPIGSVVLLKGGSKKLMISGLKPTKESQPVAVYDYIGVLYPEGFISNEYNFLFNHEDINDVVFTGYNNPERESFVEFMQQAYDNLNKNQ